MALTNSTSSAVGAQQSPAFQALSPPPEEHRDEPFLVTDAAPPRELLLLVAVAGEPMEIDDDRESGLAVAIRRGVDEVRAGEGVDSEVQDTAAFAPLVTSTSSSGKVTPRR